MIEMFKAESSRNSGRSRLGSGDAEELLSEQIFNLRNTVKQSIEWQSTLHGHFVDFEKACDSVHRDCLCLIMQSYGIPSKMISMVKTLYNLRL